MRAGRAKVNGTQFDRKKIEEINLSEIMNQ